MSSHMCVYLNSVKKLRNMSTFVLICGLAVTLQVVHSAKEVPIHSVSVVAGEPAFLPCEISAPDHDDSVLLVLWYREDLGTPIYSVDARDRDFSIAERWSDEGAFASRAYFLPERKPAVLGVDRSRSSDAGVYRCRVDFKRAQTRNSLINLTIIVPPQSIVITDEDGLERRTIVGPYLEGDNVTLHCDVFGGYPSPWVRWYRNGRLLQTSSTTLTTPSSASRATLTLRQLSRQDVRSSLECKANNNERTHSLVAALHLDMNLEPLTVVILESQQSLSAGRRYDLMCQSSGSRPPAAVTWWKDDRRLENTKETTSSDGNTTTSTLSLIPSRADSGRILACRAHNAALDKRPAPLEDIWILDVHYIPETRVRLGASLNPDNIREGSDVYFDCVIDAHPAIYKVEWRHNGHPLRHAVGAGVIVSNQSLVLQGVGRRTAGNYSCVGYNSEGDGESDGFHLDVLYAPLCAPKQQRVHGVARSERAQITCTVDANPPDVQFRWTFNNSAESMKVSSAHVRREEDTGTPHSQSSKRYSHASSTVAYTPRAERDYGTLLCWADNAVGVQRVPCVFHIVAAGCPDQLRNCTVTETTTSSFTVRCYEGFDGGLPQSFLLEVRDSVTKELKANISSSSARFSVSGLSSGGSYSLVVFAHNKKGRAAPAHLEVNTIAPVSTHIQYGANHGEELSGEELGMLVPRARTTAAWGALLGGSLVVILGLVLVAITLRKHCMQMAGQFKNVGSRAEKPSDSDVDERNPDIIPALEDLNSQKVVSQNSSIFTPETSYSVGCSRVCVTPRTLPRAPPGYCSVSPHLAAAPQPQRRCRIPTQTIQARDDTVLHMCSLPPMVINYNNASVGGACTLPRGVWPGGSGSAGDRGGNGGRGGGGNGGRGGGVGGGPFVLPAAPVQRRSSRTLPRTRSCDSQTSPILFQPVNHQERWRQEFLKPLQHQLMEHCNDDDSIPATLETPLMGNRKIESAV